MSFEPIPCIDCGALDAQETEHTTDRYGRPMSIDYCGECGEVHSAMPMR